MKVLAWAERPADGGNACHDAFVARRLRQLSMIGVDALTGIGAQRIASLKEMEIETVLDLLTHYPRRYIDRTVQTAIRDLQLGAEALVLGSVKKVSSRKTKQGRSLVEAEIFDGQAYLKVTFFNQAWRGRQLVAGTEVAVFGKVDAFRGVRQMANPVVDLIGNRTGRIVALYPQSEKSGLTTWDLAGWISQGLERAGEFVDPLPKRLRERLDLVDRTWAMRNIHLPETMGSAQLARTRLAFDELFRLQTILVMRKHAVARDAKGYRHVVPSPLVEKFLSALSFPLTGAQRRAIGEIETDLASEQPMHRLLQGDVGAGKTLVAVATMLVAVEGGHQAALMAPTEVLAEQHYAGIRTLMEQADLRVPQSDESKATRLVFEDDRPVALRLLTNRTTAKERVELMTGLGDGSIDICIGTHALISGGVGFDDLGVVIIDEQHRFGVEQRALLREQGRAASGRDPDVLVMTATPIPRSAAMTVYGDLDVTVLDELPPGRTPIDTQWCRSELQAAQAWAHVREEVAAGRQAYVVCALVEGSEKIEARSATETFEELSGGELHGIRLGLLHGQMPAPEKEQTMGRFRSGQLDVLVATTVIEVGVDVPNATVIVILDADRFGIAQLHQLRGRVGRGKQRSFCYLLSETEVPDSVARLEAIERSTDGFELAEVDLELRGEGTILGTRQKGRTDLRLASLRRDRDLVGRAREVAIEVLATDPTLQEHSDLRDELALLVDETEAAFLFKG